MAMRQSTAPIANTWHKAWIDGPASFFKDPMEAGLRKILNFGHTLGHAVETWHLENEYDLLHGEAVAIGMIMESHLSMQLEMISKSDYEQITSFILSVFNGISTVPDSEELKSLLGQDKKNIGKQIMFSLLEIPGKCGFDIQVEDGQIDSAIQAYKELIK